MCDSDGVFTQFHEALRLPDCFGWNWNALRDCLQDLHWLGLCPSGVQETMRGEVLAS
ncbi:barstar family protein [Streptomyces cinerochromogenes]|uniref:barstar family protein n=1 Tax=Streptomyces cinerochromogenes TaxID=66422 RepID=UPI003673AD4C